MVKLRKEAVWDDRKDGTLMVGCGSDVPLVDRTYMASDSMSILLREMINRRRPNTDVARSTSHSMKITTLSRACKIGLHENICRAVGGHAEPGDDMPRLYGRDYLADPLPTVGA